MIDIGSDEEWPGAALSNFTLHRFVFENTKCASMEGFLQALKFEDPTEQPVICNLAGIAAKKRGRTRNKAWESIQKLWWKGKEFDRSGREYQELLDRAFTALSQNEAFKAALRATEESSLIHTVGKSELTKTVLTEQEFCTRLMRIREKIKQEDAEGSTHLPHRIPNHRCGLEPPEGPFSTSGKIVKETPEEEWTHLPRGTSNHCCGLEPPPGPTSSSDRFGGVLM